MIVRIWEVKRVACYARAEIFTEAVASVASMVATPMHVHTLYVLQNMFQGRPSFVLSLLNFLLLVGLKSNYCKMSPTV